MLNLGRLQQGVANTLGCNKEGTEGIIPMIGVSV